MAKILFNRSAQEAKRPPEALMSQAGFLSMNYSGNQPALLFGMQDGSDAYTNTVLLGAPSLSTTAPSIPAGGTYVLGQLWCQPQYSLGSDLRVWNGTAWVDLLANSLAGFTSGQTPSKPIGARVTFLGRGPTDPLFDSSDLTAIGANSYSKATPIPNNILLGANVLPNATTLTGPNLIVGAETGVGMTSIKTSLMIGYSQGVRTVGTTAKTGTIENSIWLGTGIPSGEPTTSYNSDNFSSISDILVYTGAYSSSTGNAFLPMFGNDARDFIQNPPISKIQLSSNIVFTNYPLTFITTAPNQILSLTKSVVFGSTSPEVTTSGAISIRSNYCTNNSIFISGSALSPQSQQRRAFLPTTDSVAISANVWLGTTNDVSNTRTVAIGFTLQDRLSYGSRMAAGSLGAILIGAHYDDTTTTPLPWSTLKDPVVFATAGSPKFVMSNGAWSFKDPANKKALNFGIAGQLLRSNGSNLPPSWASPSGATGTFELPSGETVNVENGLILSIS